MTDDQDNRPFDALQDLKLAILNQLEPYLMPMIEWLSARLNRRG